MGSHKTKDQLEKELNELKNIYKDKCQECDKLSTLLEARQKDLSDARTDLSTKEACNKKLADQFYDYRTELTKVRRNLSDAIERKESLSHELEGVRGALERETDMRFKAERERDDFKHVAEDLEQQRREAEKNLNDWRAIASKTMNERDELREIMHDHSITNPESLRIALDALQGCNDRLVWDRYQDLERKLHELEHKLAEEHNVAMVQEARATDLEGQLRRKTNDCSDWMDRAFRDEAEMKKLKEHDRLAQENFEKAARRNDELQNEVNKLYQRWTDEFNPEDELLGRKVVDWQELNAILEKHHTSMPGNLDCDLTQLEMFRQMLREWHFGTLTEFKDTVNELYDYKKVCKEHDIESWFDLQKRLDEIEDLRRQSCPEEYMKVFSKYGIDSAEKLEQAIGKLNRISVATIALKNNVPYLGSIADLVKELA